MADMELDLDVASQGPARPARFVPKGSKPLLPKPQIKTEPLHINMDDNENNVVLMDVDVKEEVKEEEEEEEEEEDDDEIEGEVDHVINEIDVYFSPSIDHDTKLYVLQYPLRPLWRPYELEERCKEVRVKPDSGEVEIDLATDVDSDQNYDHSADPRLQITKQTLSSSRTPPARTAYAIGVLSGNELHLNLVHAVAQLRPSLEHLKPGGLEKKSAGNIKIEEGTAKVEEQKQIKVHGVLPEQDKLVPEWVPLQYCGARSDISASCLHTMLEKADSQIPFSMSSQDYINTLCPGTYNNGEPSIRSLLALPLDERFKVRFRKGPAVQRFNALKHFAPEVSDEELLNIIMKYARLVQGNWVAKSSLVYGTDTGLEVVARDNVLAQFRQNLVFRSRQLPHKQHLRDATKIVLKVFATPSGNDWKFDQPRDMKFLKLHPHIEQQQEKAWKKLEEQINSILSNNKSNTAPKSTLQENHVPSKNSSPKVAGSKIQNGTVFKSMPSETETALLYALKTVLREGGLRLSQICEFLRKQGAPESRHPKISVRDSEVVANVIDSYPNEFHKLTNEVAVNIHGVFVLRSSPVDSQHDALRKVVIDLLIGQGPNAKIKKGTVAEAAKLKLGRVVNNEEFKKVMTQLCVAQNTAWVLKVGDEDPNIHK